jgi:hypothetical protein
MELEERVRVLEIDYGVVKNDLDHIKETTQSTFDMVKELFKRLDKYIPTIVDNTDVIDEIKKKSTIANVAENTWWRHVTIVLIILGIFVTIVKMVLLTHG